jgi:hypothetical protein
MRQHALRAAIVQECASPEKGGEQEETAQEGRINFAWVAA